MGSNRQSPGAAAPSAPPATATATDASACAGEADRPVATLLQLARLQQFDEAQRLVDSLRAAASRTRSAAFEDAAGLLDWHRLTVQRGAMNLDLERAIGHVVRLEQRGYGELLSWAQSKVGMGIGLIGDLVTGLQWVAKAVATERRLGDPLRLSWALGNQASLLSMSKQFELALDTYAHASRLVDVHDDPYRCGMLNNMASTALYWALILEDDDPLIATLAQRALGDADAALRIALPEGRPHWLGWAHTNRGRALTFLRRVQEAEAAFALAIELTVQAPRFHRDAIAGYARLLADLGRLAQAQECLDRAEALNDDDPLSNASEQLLATQAHVCLLAGETAQARQWVDRRFRLMERRQQSRLSHTLSQALTLAGLEDTRQRAEMAEAHARQMDAASSAKSAFLAHMSHEIRTPIHAIIGLTQLLQGDVKESERAERVQGIREASQALLHIVNDILDFSKIEAGAVQIDRRPFALAGLVERVARMLRDSAGARHLEMQVQAGGLRDAYVLGDPVRLQQVLVNLVGNAIKFTPEGWVRIGGEVMHRDDRSLRVRLQVSDSGVGIPPRAQDRLFRPFSQADTNVTRQFGGTGLGLAICRRLVEMMGGRIGVRSEPGRGSHFWCELEFPVADPAVACEAPESADVPAARGTGQRLAGLRVLAVDDNRLNRLVIQRLLEREGASVKAACNGLQALEALHQAPGDFDVVLMDVHMPEMDGLQATRAIRGQPALAGLPVVALTASVLGSDREDALAAGASNFLTKPVETEALVKVLAPCLRHEASPAA